MPTKETPTAGLIAKLAGIMGEMRHIPKEGFNEKQKYKFVRESDVAEKASALLAAKNIFLHQTVVAHDLKPLYVTQSGNTMYLSTVEVAFTWMDGDTGEVLPASLFVGYGADTGDKGIYKAMTGAEKYFLMKTFLISTGDDPEADEKVDKAVAATGAAKGARIVRGAQEGVQRGGKSSMATTAQVSEIARLAKVLGLDADTVAPVIAKIIGSEPGKGQSIREWLGALTSEHAGNIVAGLAALEPEAAPTEAVEVDVEGEQEALSLV
jgi:hypothetical protein